MKRIFLLVCIIVSVFFAGYLVAHPVYSDQLDDINKQINDLQSKLDQSQKATAPLESQVSALQTQLKGIQNQVAAVTADVATKKKNIEASYVSLTQKQKILNATIRSYYINSYSFSPFLVFLSATDADSVTRTLAYQQIGTNQDKAMITSMALSITDLETRKQELETEETQLLAAQTKLNAESDQLQKVIDGAHAYQATLSNQIASLTSQQQALLAAKLSSLNIPQTAYTSQGGCSSDLTNGKDPGFSPRFGFFTFGVPNRVGMNQYGAKGRAEAGQNAETILSAYYSADLNKSYNTGINITVNGTNEYGESFNNQSMNIEDYVKHIYEVPASWPMEALKAQAVAARSYALAATNNGASSICPSQSCQVVKTEINADAWQQAVDATKGWVLTSGGNPIKAWFSSTHGGYEFTSSDIGWSSTPYTKEMVDTTGSVTNFSDLQNNAYDKGSPWFYCDWGGRASYANTAWLKPTEVADIANVILLAQKDSGTQSHLVQTDGSNPDGTDTWDANRVQSELKNRGVTPFTSVSSVSIDWDNTHGRTTTVHVNGDAGSQSFSGSDWKSYFNLRAPANIQIVGPLFNVEQR